MMICKQQNNISSRINKRILEENTILIYVYHSTNTNLVFNFFSSISDIKQQ